MCAARRHERTSARRCALQILYQAEILDYSVTTIIENGHYIEEEGIISDYVRSLCLGVETHCGSIDGYLQKTSENWSLTRMPVVDRSILRLATYEMIHVSDVPLSVSINEAVELAKDFGGEDDSPRFVNGVLGKIAELLEKGDAVVADLSQSSEKAQVEAVSSKIEKNAGDVIAAGAAPLKEEQHG